MKEGSEKYSRARMVSIRKPCRLPNQTHSNTFVLSINKMESEINTYSLGREPLHKA